MKQLTLESGSTLDLNGLALYTWDFVDNGGTILSGTVNVALVGDLNGDGGVDIADLALVGGQWNTPGQAGAQNADANADGVVDIADMALIGANWTGASTPGIDLGGAATVPTPSAGVAGLLIMSCAALRRRRGAA